MKTVYMDKTTDEQQSFPIPVITVTRHRSRKYKNHHHSIIRKKHNRVVHTNIGLSHNAYPSHNLAPHPTFHSLPDFSINNSHKSKENQIPVYESSIKSVGDVRKPICVSKIRRRHSALIQSASSVELTRSHQSVNSRSVTKNIIHDTSPVKKRKNSWANTMDYVNKHEQNLNRKKKKKCARPCCVIFMVTVLILIIIGIILLIVFLTKRNSATASSAVNPVLRWNSSGITVAGITRMSGKNDTQLNNPWGLALTYDYTLYVSDRSNNRVQKFLVGSKTATTVAGQANGASGSTSSLLSGPAAVVMDSSDSIYIGDGYSHRAMCWTKGASSGTVVGGNGTIGNTLNQLDHPYGITRDSTSQIVYVVDTVNNRIMGYNPGNITGFVVAGDHGAGLNNTQLNNPMAAQFDSITNSLIIANFLSNNIVRWTLGENSWTLLAGSNSGLPGNTSTLLSYPMGITLDPMGNLYVADRYNHRIQLFLNGQTNGTTISGVIGYPGNDSISLNEPYTLALDNQLNMYVSDNQNHRIQKFLRY